MRIRTDGDYAHREDTIAKIRAFYDRNKTESMLRAADDLPDVVGGILDVLEREDLTHKQRQEVAETMATRHFEFEFFYDDDGEIEATVAAD